MRPRELLRWGTSILAEAGVASPEADSTTLLCHVVGVDRGRLVLVEDVTTDAAEAYKDLIARRAERVPVQHLTGTAYFRHVELAVGPGVFVPRPETELLAGWAIDAAASIAESGRAPRVVELCAGSGAISLSVATEVPTAVVHAVELSPDAFAWAERNLATTSVDLRLGDMADAFADLDGTVDVVVANPPYIPLEAFESVAPEVRDHDPALALWSGQDGLDAMRVVERVAARLLVSGGVVGAEHADVQGESVPAVFAATGEWRTIRDHADLAGRARFTTARLAR